MLAMKIHAFCTLLDAVVRKKDAQRAGKRGFSSEGLRTLRTLSRLFTIKALPMVGILHLLRIVF